MYKLIGIISNFMPKEINFIRAEEIQYSINRNSYIRTQTFVIFTIYEQVPYRK